MPRYFVILLIVFSLVAGISLTTAIHNRKDNKLLRQQIDNYVKSTEQRIDKILLYSDSLQSEIDLLSASEQRNKEKYDSLVQSYQKDIRSLKSSVWTLKQERNEIQKELDSLTNIIDLPEL